MDMTQMSMVDVAYELMLKKKKEVEFSKLFKEVSEIKGFTLEEAEEKESLFYTNITMDGRFITVGENRWDLRERHKFESVHIDMNDIYADYQDEEENDDDDSEEVKSLEEDEDDDGISAEDSYDDE